MSLLFSGMCQDTVLLKVVGVNEKWSLLDYMT